MKILLDTADINVIEQLVTCFPIEGFTTNPTILSKQSGDVRKTLLEMKRIAEGKRMIHAQVTAASAEGMFTQAKELKAFLGNNFYAKIPITDNGLRAVKMCADAGINSTVTAVFTPMQALMAALAGADYVAPYVDRLDNITCDGVQVVEEIAELFEIHGVKTKIVAASFKNVQQVYGVARAGAHSATVGPDLCKKLIFHPYTDKSITDFGSDWRFKFGNEEITDLIR